MRYRYSRELEENMARAVGISLPISLKHSIEVCNFVRGKNIEVAKQMLDDVVSQKLPVPFKRFIHNVGHRKGGRSGRYPTKAASEIRKVLEAAQKNAQFKGLSTANLTVLHLSAKTAEGGWHYGRHLRRSMKRATVEVILEEAAELKKGRKGEEKKAKKVEKKTK